MKILHISDLHLTSPFEHFEQVWLPIAGTLKTERFEAVIVSGDLTQAAAPSEYEQLERFLKRDVLPLVGGDRERIVLVPGNHDVAWNAEVGTQRGFWAAIAQEPTMNERTSEHATAILESRAQA